jgi:O-antigen/teichoic acid export membrane protein
VRALVASRVLAWAGRGFWAVVDQTLFAGTNFLVSVLLARWLEPDAYGAFAVAYSVFLLLGTLHTALWTEPMLVYGSGRFREVFTAYQRVLIGYHWRFGALAGFGFCFLGLGFLAFGGRELGLSLLGLGLAAPAVLYLWLVRRGAYVLLEPRLAALGGVLYLLLYVGSSLLLLRLAVLNEATAFLAMTVAGYVAAGVIRVRVRTGTHKLVDPREVRSLHWGYGRWALLAGALSWVPGNVYYVWLPAFHGLEVAARLKALMNLLMPILHFNGALGQLLVPSMARSYSTGGLVRITRASLVIFLGFALTYWAVLAVFGRQLMGWIYGEKYAGDHVWLAWLGFLPLFAAVTSVKSSLLRALERPKVVAKTYGLLAGLSLASGLSLIWADGLRGAIVALLLTNALASLAFARNAGAEVRAASPRPPRTW